ncbi:hypothetical protein IGJ55_002131 [Enterococcus sp. AZ170]|uniref:helix-turn-helix domain-containing protein n=1 Tax=unclassified Enterococcus TaxID=2608891 RepID=UPI003D281CE1
MEENVIGSQIQKLRSSRNLTQEELAEKIGVSKQTISNWETGLKSPRPNAIRKLSEFFNVSISYSVDNIQSQDIVKEDYSIYKVSNFIHEVEKATKGFTEDEKDEVLNLIYDIKSGKSRHRLSNTESLSIYDLAKSLSNTDIQSIDNLSNYIIRVINGSGQVYKEAEELLKDCKIAIDANKTATIEFMNTKRKIYDLLMPLASLTNAFEQNINTLKGLADALKFSREFVLEAISYHASSKGSIIEYDGFIIDFSDVPVEYEDIDNLDNFEISISDTNKRRSESRNKQNRKLFKKTR